MAAAAAAAAEKREKENELVGGGGSTRHTGGWGGGGVAGLRTHTYIPLSLSPRPSPRTDHINQRLLRAFLIIRGT